MNVTLIAPVSYDYAGASAATGLSHDVIRQAVNAGELAVRYPVVNGRTLTKPVIEADELRRWVSAGKTERPKG